MTITLDALDAAIDGRDVARLRRMKLTATGFLAAAAATYVATFASNGGGAGVLGFVRAGSEAAMVGGLADWFAVTALFRRPLHLPIPHTAIIAQQKDEIATKLGTFVTANFLTPQLLTRHLQDAHLVAKIGARLREPVYADRLGVEVSHAVAVALEETDTEWLIEFAFGVARRDLDRRSYAPVLGQMLNRAVSTDAQRPLLELVAGFAADYIRDNRAKVRHDLKSFLEARHWLAWLITTEKRMDKLIADVLDELDEARRDPRHWFWVWLDDRLRDFANNLENDATTAAQLDSLVRHFLEDERYQELLRTFANGFAESLRAAIASDSGGLDRQVSQFLQNIGTRIAEDSELEARLEAWLLRAVIHAVREYGNEFTVLIQRTVAGWDPTSASRRIEVAVGRDLQFIRINGTVVGALAGLAIHAITLALP